jgi:hypothetical protein
MDAGGSAPAPGPVAPSHPPGMTTGSVRALALTLGFTALASGCASQGAYLNEGPTSLGKAPYQVGPVPPC